MKPSKYNDQVLLLIDSNNIKSTRQILKELEKKVNKVINWHMVYKVLNDLYEKGLIKKLENNAGLFWTK